MKQLIRHNKWYSIGLTAFMFALLMTALVIPEAAAGVAGLIGLSGAGFGGSMLAVGTTVTGPVTAESTSGASSTHYQRSVDDVVTIQKPQDTPLDTLMRRISKKKKAKHHKHEWEEVSVRSFEDTTTATFTAAGTAADESVTLSVTNTEIWSVDDTGIAPGISGGDSNDLVFQVTAVDEDADTITITGVNGADVSGTITKRIPTIASGTKIYRMAKAKSALSAQSTVKYQVPVFDYNYNQNFQCQLEEGVLEAQYRSESGYDFNDKKMLELYNYRSEINFAYYFGNRRVQTIGGEQKYFAGGIINKISNEVEFGSGAGAMDISADDVIDICETLFAPNNGSERRYLMAGKKLVSALDKIDTSSRRLEWDQEEIVVGMKVKKLVSSHGELIVVPDKTLDIITAWQQRGVILDFEHLMKAELFAPQVTKLKLDESGTRRVKNAIRLDESSCPQLRYAGSGGVHGIIKPAA